MANIHHDYHDEADRKRIDRLHKNRMSSSMIISAIIRQAIGKEIVSYDRILKGEVSEVLDIHIKNYPNVILRIAHNNSKYESETWAIEQCKKQSVPVANIIAIGKFDLPDKSLQYTVHEKLTGKTLDILVYMENIDKQRAKFLTEQAGEILAKIHSVKTTNWGGIDNNGAGMYKTANDYEGHRKHKQKIYQSIMINNNLSAEFINQVFNQLDKASTIFEKPHLIHSDYGPKHLFVSDKDEIIGVIDFEDVKSGDSTHEFSSWQFWFEETNPLEWLLSGYKRLRPLGDNFDERLRISTIHRMLSMMSYYTETSKSPDRIEAAKIKLVEFVNKA